MRIAEKKHHPTSKLPVHHESYCCFEMSCQAVEGNKTMKRLRNSKICCPTNRCSFNKSSMMTLPLSENRIHKQPISCGFPISGINRHLTKSREHFACNPQTAYRTMSPATAKSRVYWRFSRGSRTSERLHNWLSESGSCFVRNSRNRGTSSRLYGVC